MAIRHLAGGESGNNLFIDEPQLRQSHGLFHHSQALHRVPCLEENSPQTVFSDSQEKEDAVPRLLFARDFDAATPSRDEKFPKVSQPCPSPARPPNQHLSLTDRTEVMGCCTAEFRQCITWLCHNAVLVE
ncbi:hypothetical protein DPEC_G00328880 [Dallia pectoralis]|uniref:Uncharacterized protein n=1 Tax=Dallia pectoralis TaxID=75939 RepID=A0ACC2F8H8_DALPE|nr:hypothetical protein DPEC_G00328880 [Dallia pectoralis]